MLAVRLLGYLGRDHDAVALAGEAVATHPDNARLLRLRGEKRLLTRDPRGAAADLEAATDRLVAGHDIGERYREDVEAAVLAHVLGRPSPVADHRAQRLQLRAVTWHHLGVARYLLGEFSPPPTPQRSRRRHCRHPLRRPRRPGLDRLGIPRAAQRRDHAPSRCWH